MSTTKNQFSLRSTICLTVAVAYWIAVLKQFQSFQPLDIAILGGFAVIAGIVSHFVYVFWLPWRVTVIATVFLLFNAFLQVVAVGVHVSLVERAKDFILVAVTPVEAMTRVREPREILQCVMVVLGTVVFAAAHPVRPSLPTAMITALGVALWYSFSLLILASAG